METLSSPRVRFLLLNKIILSLSGRIVILYIHSEIPPASYTRCFHPEAPIRVPLPVSIIVIFEKDRPLISGAA